MPSHRSLADPPVKASKGHPHPHLKAFLREDMSTLRELAMHTGGESDIERSEGDIEKKHRPVDFNGVAFHGNVNSKPESDDHPRHAPLEISSESGHLAILKAAFDGHGGLYTAAVALDMLKGKLVHRDRPHSPLSKTDEPARQQGHRNTSVSEATFEPKSDRKSSQVTNPEPDCDQCVYRSALNMTVDVLLHILEREGDDPNAESEFDESGLETLEDEADRGGFSVLLEMLWIIILDLRDGCDIHGNKPDEGANGK